MSLLSFRINAPLTVFSLLLAAYLCSANPRPMPTAITEIMVTNPYVWTIEIDLEEMNLKTADPPCTTDSITLFCTTGSIMDEDSLKTCASPVMVTAGRTALLDNTNFPGQRITAGTQIYYGRKGGQAEGDVYIDNLPSAGESLVREIRSYCCEEIGGTCVMTCESINFVVSTCPTPGVANESSVGIIKGNLLDSAGAPLPGIQIICNSYPSNRHRNTRTSIGSGGFALYVDTCDIYVLKFQDTLGGNVMDTTVGPLQFSQTQQLTMNIKLPYKAPPVSARAALQRKNGRSGLRILPSRDGKGGPVVVTLDKNVDATEGRCEIFSLDGSLLRSTQFVVRGAGTYTIPWEGVGAQGRNASAATYVCRIKIGQELWCKEVISR